MLFVKEKREAEMEKGRNSPRRLHRVTREVPWENAKACFFSEIRGLCGATDVNSRIQGLTLNRSNTAKYDNYKARIKL